MPKYGLLHPVKLSIKSNHTAPFSFAGAKLPPFFLSGESFVSELAGSSFAGSKKVSSSLNVPMKHVAFSFCKLKPFYSTFYQESLFQSLSINKMKRTAWSLKFATDGSRLNSSPANDSTGGTRLIRVLQSIRFKLMAKLDELRNNFPLKIFFFLVGIYCATAFATVIGQTGDWDVLSAAVAVAVVEGIGAIMYRPSLPLGDNIRNVVIIFNYWKVGLTVGLFLDSFKF